MRPSFRLCLVAVVAAGLAAGSACGTSAPPATRTSTGPDAFAGVRATSVAAYQAGHEALNRGDLEAALVSFDQARVNDPDSRPDIQDALDETVRRIRERPVPPTRTPIPTPTRSPLQEFRGPAPAVETPEPAPTSASLVPSGFTRWNDSVGRFNLATPTDWSVQFGPRTEFGSGVVSFRDPSGRAEFAVSVDEDAKVISPELYAAKMEIAMGELPASAGYALESVQPGVTAGGPSMRRNFSIRQRDSNGREILARGFQVAVLRGSTPYILSALSPANDYARFEPVFDRILSTFSFR